MQKVRHHTNLLENKNRMQKKRAMPKSKINKTRIEKTPPRTEIIVKWFAVSVAPLFHRPLGNEKQQNLK
jgi:hypothetical protein